MKNNNAYEQMKERSDLSNNVLMNKGNEYEEKKRENNRENTNAYVIDIDMHKKFIDDELKNYMFQENEKEKKQIKKPNIYQKEDENFNFSESYTEENISDGKNNLNSESETNIESNKSLSERFFSPFTPGGVRSSTVLFTCTAIGTGFLSLPFAFSKLGIILSLILIMLNALESYTTTNILCVSSLEHHIFVYGNLVKKIGNSFHKFILDIGLALSFMSGYVLILIIISNFIRTFFEVLNFPSFYMNRIFLVTVICVLFTPLSIKKNVGALNYFLVLSLLALIVTLITVSLQVKFYRSLSPNKNILLFNIDKEFFKCYNIILFCFSQQTNACFITGQFHKPTYKRINKSASRSILLQIIFYFLIGTLGYISFYDLTKDNIMMNYENSNLPIFFCKLCLSTFFFFALPLNFMGSYKSILSLFLGIRNVFCIHFYFMFHINRNRENLLENLSVQDSFETNSTNFTDFNTTLQDDHSISRKQKLFVSIVVSIICALISLNVEHLSNVIGIGGGLTSTLINCFLPNLIYFKNRRQIKKRHKKYLTLFMLTFFSFTGFFSVFYTFYKLIVS